MNRRIAGLFLAALLGTLVVVGIVVAQLGLLALLGYVALVLVGLVLLGRQARRLRPAPVEDGRTCSCCTTTVFDPIEIV